VVPNLAVIEDIKRRGGHDILYIGSVNGVEKKMTEKEGVKYVGVHVGKLRRYFSWQNFLDIVKVPMGFVEAIRALKEFKADVVFSKGGYVSVPVALAARALKIPLIVHESDVSVGLANSLCFKFANKICLSFEETKNYLNPKLQKKAVVTGSPIRAHNGNKELGLKFCGFDKHRPVLLVMGGSQGAMQINKLVDEGLDDLLKKFQIIHIRGRGNLNIGIKSKGYAQFEYVDKELFDLYAAANLVVTRGGANSLFELAYLKKKSLIIPLATGRGEQSLNAEVLAGKLGWSILSGNMVKGDFVNAIIMAEKNNMNKSYSVENGTIQIVDLILK